MKVLLINGSPRKNGNTHISLAEVASALEAEGISTEIMEIGVKPVQGCTGCNKCREIGRCVFKDELYEKALEKVQEADGIVIGSPTYYSAPNGSLCALLDRLFYSGGRYMRHKPGAAVAVCRRGGASTTFDRLIRYFTITDMPVVPSQYWPLVYGHKPGEASQDAEGMQTLRKLGRNMAWMLKNLHAGGVPVPESEQRVMTNFIR